MHDPRPEATPGDAERALLGTWRLVSWGTQAPDGTVTYPFGERAVAYLVYTEAGRRFAQLMRHVRPSCSSGDMRRRLQATAPWAA